MTLHSRNLKGEKCVPTIKLPLTQCSATIHFLPGFFKSYELAEGHLLHYCAV